MIGSRVNLGFYTLFPTSNQIFVLNIKFAPKNKLSQISLKKFDIRLLAKNINIKNITVCS